MKPSPEARDLLGYTWRERMNRWILRQWWWISALLLLILYMVVDHFDRVDRDTSNYQRIERLQAQIDSQRQDAFYREPVYFLIEAHSPSEMIKKLTAVGTAIDVQRLHAFNERDSVERK